MPILEVEEDDALYLPNEGGQQQFMDDWVNRYVAMAGGWYAGKTWAGARKLVNLHIHNAMTDPTDGTDPQPTFVGGLAVGQDYQLARTLNIPELQAALDEAGLSWRFVADQKLYWFELPDFGTKKRPSTIRVRSADAPEKINGFTIGHAWGDEVARWKSSPEDPTRDPLLQLKGRLRDTKAKFRQAIYTFTHEGDETSVYRDFVEKPLPSHRLYTAGSFENPEAIVFAGELEGQLTKELADQYLRGVAASFRGGKVYGSYTEANLRRGDELQLTPHLPLQLAMDFNINPGMHGVVGQHFEDKNTATAVHEFHAKSMSTIQMLAAFRSWVSTYKGPDGRRGWQWPQLEVYGDVSGNARWIANGVKTWDVVREWFEKNMPDVVVRYRIPTENPGVSDRVNAMNCALRTVSGQIRYLVHERCERLVEDFKRLKWDGNELGKDDRKLSHASDADGYRIAWIMPVRTLRPVRVHAST